MGGLLFIGLGMLVIAASGWLARCNRSIRSQLVAHYEARVRQVFGQTLRARMEMASAQFQLSMANASLEAGRLDRVCIILVGLTAMGVGIFMLFHPHGW